MYFWDSLAHHGDRSALISQSLVISYAELARQADKFREDVHTGLPVAVVRPLILLEASNSLGAIIAYIAALRADWPVILVTEGASDDESEIVQTYKPNVILRRADDWRPSFAAAEAIEMHLDLAVLLSTSGTTGAAKLVRLSRQNLTVNAEAIANYLDVLPEDRAITLLPFHYSYGMSVLHTHLLRGAGLVLTEGSLIDADVRTLAQQTGVSSLALVPTQFELLDTLDWLPRLRYITQAGGRLDPVLARRFADQALAEGWQLFIMYGQTEAAPRMSYVPPKDAKAWFHTIGRPLEGGKFSLLDDTGSEISGTGVTGELVYEGPNVMLGYAISRADLSAVAGPSVLQTGDMAERLENGYFRITGRASRFIKLFGLRIGLDEVETQLRAEGIRVFVTGTDARLVVFVQDATDFEALSILIAKRYHLPQRAIRLAPIKTAPLLASGKVDYRALARHAAALELALRSEIDTHFLLRQALRMPVLDLERNFLELGGDSLAYIDVQMHLLELLGEIPDSWEQAPLREVLSYRRTQPKVGTVVPASFQVVRADLIARVVSILSVIALHSTTWPTGGGSYLLLVLVGYSLARFQSAVLFEGNILRTWRSMLVPILTCYYLLVCLTALIWHPVSLPWFLLLGNFETNIQLKGLIPYWFVSAYSQVIFLFTLPFLLPPLRQQIARHPLFVGLMVLAAAVLAIFFSSVADIAAQIRQRHPLAAFELVVLGWCIFFAHTTAQRAAMTVVTLLVWWSSWHDADHGVNLMLLCGTGAVIWGLRLNLPALLARTLMQAGTLTLFLYIVHAPVISVVTHLDLQSNILRFTVVVTVSLLAAATFKAVYDWADSKLTTGMAKFAIRHRK